MADFRTEYEKVYQAIRNAVIAGQYAPGERLPQRKLAETFNTTTITVREALRFLEQDGLILIDQHAAHERIMYEKLKRRSEGLKVQAQKLLVPETVELGYREAAILEKLLPEFEGIGLEIEPFGGNTFVVKAVPELLAGRQIKPLILDIVEEMAAEGFSAGPAQSIDACLKIMACHSTIRARQALDEKQLQGLLSQLDQCENPSHCPHGRPTWIQWTVKELEKAFNRIV